MAVSDVYRVEIFQNVGSEQTLNVLHFREVTAETVLANPAEGPVAAAHAIYLALADELSEDWRVIQITGRRVFPTPGIPYTRVLGAGDAIEGVIVSEIVPAQAAILTSLYSSNASKQGRGRIYIPGCPELSQNEGQLLESPYTNLQTWAEAWFTDVLGPFAPGDATWWATIYGPVSVPGPLQDVIQPTVRPNLATQKRRRAHPGFGA